MRNLCSAAIAASLILSSAASADPLSSGKPAGIHDAQMANSTLLIVVGVGVVAAAIALAASSSNGGGPTAVTTSPISTTTTG